MPEPLDDRLLTQWISQYQTDLLRLCYLFLRDWSLAEDAVQETFLKAYRRGSSFQGRSSVKTWLVHIAVNTCKDMHRKAWVRNHFVQTQAVRMPDPGTDDDDWDLALTQPYCD